MNSARKRTSGIILDCVAALAIGAFIFLGIYGYKILNPCYADWILNNIGGGLDLSQHYLGWRFYRESSWLMPMGMLDNLAYPLKSSVIFTDSIPIIAFVFKIFSPLLPETFQYFGLYGLTCFCLQSLFGMLITRRLGGGRVISLLGGLLYTLSPVMTDRMFRHTALASHWMILMAIYLFLGSVDRGGRFAREIIGWTLLGFLAGAVHLYFLPMTGVFCASYALISAIVRRHLKYLAVPFAYLAATVGAVWIFGGFSSGVSAEADGLGDYSFNLNGLINSADRSKLIKALPLAFPGQNEGFSYLGAGVLLLLTLVFIFYGLRFVSFVTSLDDEPGGGRKRGENVRTGSTLIVVASIILFLGFLIFALSPVITMGDMVLYTMSIHSKTRHLWNIFRSTGRMIWPPVYLLITAGIYSLLRFSARFTRGAAVADQILVMCLCIVLQVFDLQGWFLEKRQVFTKEQVYETELTGKYWDDMAGKTTHLFVSDAVTMSESRVFETAEWAADHGMTLNNFYFARGIPGVREEYNKRLDAPQEGDLFLFTPEDTELDRASGTLELTDHGRYVVGVPKPGHS